jgi:hypothetical protein
VKAGLQVTGQMFTPRPAKSLASFIVGAALLVATHAQAETRWVGGFGLRLCDPGLTKCVRLSTGTELEVTGGRLLTSDIRVGTLYEVMTADGIRGWISEADLKTVLVTPQSDYAQGQETACTEEPRVGMSEQEALKTCWGRPKYRRRVGVEGLMRDEWVYGDGRYLYFDDGKILAIQTQ